MEQAIEQDIQAAGKTGPRVTPEHVSSVILKAEYYVFPGTTVTICLLHLKNGFSVTGESACASPENFDPLIGKRIAFENARLKIWALEGYLLRNELSKAPA